MFTQACGFGMIYTTGTYNGCDKYCAYYECDKCCVYNGCDKYFERILYIFERILYIIVRQ